MRALPTDLRKQLEAAVLEGRHAAEAGVRAALASLGVREKEKPAHLNEDQARLRRGLRAKQRQLGGEFEVMVWDAAYEQWHRLLFARFLAENGFLRHPQFDAPVSLGECEELAEELGEPDGWSVAARFAAEILPGIFRLEDPCVQLRLAPEHRVALEGIVAKLPKEVFAADDSLGWVYQYWQSERKDQVNASEVKVGGPDLRPVTQLFTENYMVRFLLENSLGAWWAVRHPDSPLVKEFEYLRFGEDGRPAAGTFEGWPNTVAEVTVMDPCCGSGHFLVEAFGMLWRMRAEEEGLDPVAAQDAVLADNLFGLELDPRCVQIAMFAVALSAWKQGGGWRHLLTPNIACSGIPAKAPLEEWTGLAVGDERIERALERLHSLFKDADTLGSLIDPRRAAELEEASGQLQTGAVDFAEVAPLIEKAAARETDNPVTTLLGADAAGIARAAGLLSRSYTLIVTNVPYLARPRQGTVLRAHGDRGYGDAKNDIATMFLQRFRRMRMTGGVAATVTPQNWTFLKRYQGVRESLLRRETPAVMAALGAGAFDALSGHHVKAFLSVSYLGLAQGQPVSYITLDDASGPNEKSSALRNGKWDVTTVASLRSVPEARFLPELAGTRVTLGTVANAWQGIATSDFPRFGRYFWERPCIDGGWHRQQSTVPSTRPYGGREAILYWQDGHGAMTEVCQPGATFRGEGAWGRRGVVVSQTGNVPITLYTGEKFDNNTAVITPRDESLVPAIWAFCSSAEFPRLVRLLDRKLAVTNATFNQVPFDVERWRRVAAEELPGGLPEPWSDDPTQWLFEGRPEVATEPLQVGVGRLVGYRWPDQPDTDLDELVDGDGIVCLPAVRGERPAADRLQALLARAYGGAWSPGLVRQLLEDAEAKKKNLADWLRDDFFQHHCKVFSNRPFVWHIWDGRKDGFSALVNYHRLNRAGLEKLTYTYLGDWIERQRADAGDGVPGADVRLAVARQLKAKLEAILEGEPPYDIYVRWKELHEQPIGWDPDLDDGVRLNIRPFVKAGVLRSRVNVHWRKDRGKNPDGSERRNDLHYRIAEKQEARQKVGRA